MASLDGITNCTYPSPGLVRRPEPGCIPSNHQVRAVGGRRLRLYGAYAPREACGRAGADAAGPGRELETFIILYVSKNYFITWLNCEKIAYMNASCISLERQM